MPIEHKTSLGMKPIFTVLVALPSNLLHIVCNIPTVDKDIRAKLCTTVTGLALHTLMQGTATTARYTKRYVQVD